MNERGSGSVLALAILGAIFALFLLLVPLAAVLQAKARSSGAADAAALAAADVVAGLAPGVPCEVAARVAAANGVKLGRCTGDGEAATVSVETTVFGIRVAASARAGPRGAENR